MATIQSLVVRVLVKLAIVDGSEPPDAADALLAQQKLEATHASLKKDRLTQWTLQDIPDYAEEPYVQIAAFLAAPEFKKVVDPTWYLWGRSEIEAGLQRYQAGTVQVDYF